MNQTANKTLSYDSGYVDTTNCLGCIYSQKGACTKLHVSDDKSWLSFHKSDESIIGDGKGCRDEEVLASLFATADYVIQVQGKIPLIINIPPFLNRK